MDRTYDSSSSRCPQNMASDRHLSTYQPWRSLVSSEHLAAMKKTQTEEYFGKGNIRTRPEITTKK
jgi:hypothetical protein